MRVLACIPCRYASTRLPGKPLCTIGNKPMVLHVLERAKKAKRLDEVMVLTDDARIFDVVKAAGYPVSMTSAECSCGTERIAEYARTCQKDDIFVNIQGDEVLLDAGHVDHLVDDFLAKSQRQMGTLAHWMSDRETLKRPGTAKVVTDRQLNALYFSRNCIPVTQEGEMPERALVHIGVYIYSQEILHRLSGLKQSMLENTEKLEQLRALENGIQIGVTIVDNYQSLSVDTKEDLNKAQMLFGGIQSEIAP